MIACNKNQKKIINGIDQMTGDSVIELWFDLVLPNLLFVYLVGNVCARKRDVYDQNIVIRCV